MNTPSPTRAAIYLRISSDPSGKALGVARQEAACRSLCESRGWEVAAVFEDNDTSAYSGKRRPEYDRMMVGLAAGEFSAILAYNADRLYRRIADLASFIDAVKAAHADVATVSGGDYDLNTADGRLTAGVHGVVAAHQSERASERIRAKMLELAVAGKPHGGAYRAYGFADDGITHDEHEAAVIREVAARLIAGESVRAVCLDLNRRGDLTSKQHPWSVNVLTRTLLRPRLVGKRVHGDAQHDAAWQPILDDLTAVKLRVVLTSHKRRPGRQPRYLLTSILVCDVCGAGLQHTSGRTRSPAYACPAAPRGRQCVSVNAERAEHYLTSATLAVSDSMPLDHVEPVEVNAADELREQMTALNDMWLRKVMPQVEYERAMATLTNALTEVESRLAEVLAAQRDVSVRRAGRLRDEWDDNMTVDEQRDAIALLLGKVRVSTVGKTLDVPLRRPTTADDLLAARFQFNVAVSDHLVMAS
jgi:site-specific DNA recombinase